MTGDPDVVWRCIESWLPPNKTHAIESGPRRWRGFDACMPPDPPPQGVRVEFGVLGYGHNVFVVPQPTRRNHA
jgi:hypothetical protein